MQQRNIGVIIELNAKRDVDPHRHMDIDEDLYRPMDIRSNQTGHTTGAHIYKIKIACGQLLVCGYQIHIAWLWKQAVGVAFCEVPQKSLVNSSTKTHCRAHTHVNGVEVYRDLRTIETKDYRDLRTIA